MWLIPVSTRLSTTKLATGIYWLGRGMGYNSFGNGKFNLDPDPAAGINPMRLSFVNLITKIFHFYNMMNKSYKILLYISNQNLFYDILLNKGK